MENQAIVLDFGGSLTLKIARQVRNEGVYCQVLSGDASREQFGGSVPGAIICADFPEEIAKSHPDIPRNEVLDIGCPVLDVGKCGDEAKVSAESDLAFRPEFLRDFLFKIAGLKPGWTMRSFISKAVDDIRTQVGDGHVVAGASGGVDSTVCIALVHKAIGDRLHSVLVDHGFMRQGEADYVSSLLSSLGVKVNVVDAKDRFMSGVRGVSDPEDKRKIIGEEFIRVFEEAAEELGSVTHLLQGTIYTDVIESGLGLRGVVKSHHNVGGLPERMGLKLLEPVRDLFKDEVRLLGKELGLTHEFTGRHPFPGPGLAIRVLGEVTEEKLDIVRRSQAILDQEIREAGWYDRLWQCFCVLPNVRSVGVKGEKRSYGHLLTIRAVESKDAVQAVWARLPHDLLDRIACRIADEVPEVNRVALDITSKPPSTIEWE